MAAAVVPLTETEPYQDIDGKACRRFAAGLLERCLRDALMDFNRTSNVHAWLAAPTASFLLGSFASFWTWTRDRLREQIEKHIEKPTPELIEKLFAVPLGSIKKRGV